MAAPYIETPRTELGDQTRLGETHLDFSMEPSFVSPSKSKHDLISQMRGGSSGRNSGVVSTPFSRHPLASRNANAAKNEFTPLLKSAARNRVIASAAREGFGLVDNGRIRTPAVLKPGYKFQDSPALPEASTIYDAHTASDSEITGAGTPGPPVASSSMDLSTPMALAKRGEGGLDGGNMLTLREQEAVSFSRLVMIGMEKIAIGLKD